jgi:hypothetical protein
MGFFARLFGSDPVEPVVQQVHRRPSVEDERAIEQYRYLLRTAPPETIEQAHAEAFTRLTDDQRAQIYEELSRGAGTGERPLSSEPATLARAAARSEMRIPGALERSLRGSEVGDLVVGSLLGVVAGYVTGSALVSAFLPWDTDSDADTAESASPDFAADGDFSPDLIL